MTFFSGAHAENYDSRQAQTLPIRNALQFLLRQILGELPADARILSVGAGTGLEIEEMAKANPQWRFTAVEPSPEMLAICRKRAEHEGFTDRCEFHEGFIESLPEQAPFHAATTILVSQFILDKTARENFYRNIAGRLATNALLVSADLGTDSFESPTFNAQIGPWARTVAGDAKNIKEGWKAGIAMLPPEELDALIENAGFSKPTRFFQALFIHGQFARRLSP